MDGEVEARECQQLLKNMSTCDSSRNKWERFHLVRELLVEEKGHLTNLKLSNKIEQAISLEPHHIASTTWFKRPETKAWYKQVVGMGLAASVTALLVTGVYKVDQSESLSHVQPEFAAQFTPVILDVEPASARFNAPSHAPDLAQQQRLQALFLQHTKSASDTGLKGMFPYAKIISYGRVPTHQTQRVEVKKENK